MVFRMLVEKELDLIKSALNKLSGDCLDEWFNSFDRIVARTGKRLKVFAMSKSEFDLVNHFQVKKGNVLAAGVYLGMIFGKPPHFYPSLGVVSLIASMADRWIIVDKEGAQHFLYGKDVRPGHVCRLKRVEPNERALVLDAEGGALGIAMLKDDKGLQHVLDLGLYLRKVG